MRRKLQAAVLLALLAGIVQTAYREQSRINEYEQRGRDALEAFSQSVSQPEQEDTENSERQCAYRVVNPRVNYVEDPMGIDTQEITFSWELAPVSDGIGVPGEEGEERWDGQAAYQILVEDEDGRLVWDSGIAESDRTFQISYQGEALKDLTSYTYRILSYDSSDGCAVSEMAGFTTAYLAGHVFSGAKMICMQEEENVYGDGQAVFYQAFSPEEKTVRRAYYFGSALGVYDTFINGERVGQDEMKPGWTDYRDALLYNMYDVTKLLAGGQENYVATMLGTGWWCGRNAFGTYDFHRPALIGQLVILYEDGTEQVIGTDETWQYYKDTRVQFADFFNGETVDMSKPDTAQIASAFMKELPGKACEESHDFSGVYRCYYGYQYRQSEALTQTVKSGYVYDTTRDNGSTYGEVVKKREFETDTAQMPKIALKKGETLVVDLGQNIAGVPQITCLSDAENEITVTFAEMLNDCGEEDRGNDGPKGSLYRKNYRSAATTVSILPEKGVRMTYAPSYFFTGFRYLSVTAREDVTIFDLKGVCLTNVSPQAGSFSCDNEPVNRLYENVLWSQRNNYTLIATDCPQRDERIGWTGDLRSFCPTSLYNQDLYSFYRKWSDDVIDAQTEEGAFTDTVPMTIHTGSGNSGWADAGITVPLQVYEKYGDLALLEQNYPSMQRYMEYLERISSYDSGERRMGAGTVYGDWLSGEMTDNAFLSALWYAADSLWMQKAATVLGRERDRKAYEALHGKLKAYIQRTYLEEADSLEKMSQTELCFLIRYELLDEAPRRTAVRALTESVEQNDYLLMTGFAGTPVILDTLTQIGRSDLAYRILLAEGNPSWLYSVRQGATTIWERYDSYTIENGFADFAMNSFDHFNEGSVAQWLYEDMLGIRVDLTGETPILIQPYLPDGQTAVRQAEGSYHSVFGEISVRWRIEDKREASFEITVPCNAKAKIILPLQGFGECVCGGGIYKYRGTLTDGS